MGPRDAYDRVAQEYAKRIDDELIHKPFDRDLLDRIAADLPRDGWVIDLGAGPGQVGAYLAGRGARVVAVDLSAAMLVEAERLHPELHAIQADMRRLPFGDATLAGVVAFYSLIHIEPPEVLPALRDIARVLRPGAPAVIAVHIGEAFRHMDEWWGHEVSLDFHFFDPDALAGAVAAAGLEIVDALQRDPYPDGVEADTRRVYIVARKPD